MNAPLKLPSSWRETIEHRYREHLAPRLALTRAPWTQWDPGCTEIEVKYDLQEGAWLSRGRRSGDYELGGKLFKLELRFRPAKIRSERMIAVVNRLREFEGVPPTARMKPEIEFARIGDEAPCDLEGLFDGLRSLEAAQERLVRPRVHPHLSFQSELGGTADREMRTLGAIFEVLSERSDRQQPWRSPGRVLPGGDIRIELEQRCNAGPGVTVEVISARGRAVRAQVAKSECRTLLLHPVDDWMFKAGADVVVERPVRFTFRPNMEAVRRFSQRQTEGAWQDLAALLFRTKSLTAPRRQLEPPDYFCDEDPDGKPLNELQRQAVVKALSTPHAFLLQGPPGTGKTSVISELVRQFHRRGERVLLLAQSNVAVDEVLNRVGARPGVQALRITFDESVVDPACHPFLFDRLEGDLTGRLPEGGADRRSIWDAKRSRLTAEIEEAEAAVAACEAERQAIEDRRAAEDLLARIRAEGIRDGGAARFRLAGQELVLRAVRTAAPLARQEAAAAADSRRAWEQGMQVTAAAADQAVRTALRLMAEADETHRSVEERRSQWMSTNQQVATGEVTLHAWRQRAEYEWPDLQARMAKTEAQIAKLDAKSAGAGLWGRITAGRLARVQKRWRALADRRAELVKGDARAAQAAAVIQREKAELADLHRQILDLEQRRTAQQREVTVAGSEVERRLQDLGCIRDRARPPASGGRRLDYRAITSALKPLLASGLEEKARPPAMITAGWDFSPIWASRLRLRDAAARTQDDSATAGARLAEAERLRDEYAEDLAAAEQEADRRDAEAEDVLARARNNADATVSRRRRIAGDPPPDLGALRYRISAATRQRDRLDSMARLRDKWDDLLDANGIDEMVEDIRDSLVRGTNLVCGTTAGIVGRGSDPVRSTDFDVLILDEASRVTCSEFLIGAVRCRRWILVGDEHQLPPHVDDESERHLHALAALKGLQSGRSQHAKEAVETLSGPWTEADDDLRKIRIEEVTGLVEQLRENGEWDEVYRDRMKRVKTADLLRAMKNHMVKSLFEQVVEKAPDRARTKLTEQRRMIPALSRVVRDPVYAGDYRDPPAGDPDVPQPIVTQTFAKPAVFLDTSLYGKRSKDEPRGSSRYSPLEAKAVAWVLRTYDKELRKAGERDVSYGVLSFYKAQANAINRELAGFRPAVLERKVVGSIDSLQGQQADIIVISFVRSVDPRFDFGPDYGLWLQDLRRLNVACTRARRALVLVGHGETLRRLHGEKRQGAKEFYRHLFELFEAKGSDYLTMTKFGN
jgi:DNA polymerase III delta prime subunit